MPEPSRRTLLGGALATAGAVAFGYSGQEPAYATTPSATRTVPKRNTTGEWALPRGDAQNTGFQALPGEIRRPTIRSRTHLGGSASRVIAEDLGPGVGASLLFTTAGQIVATDASLAPLWTKSGIPSADILGAYDLAGDGTKQVVVIGGAVVWVLSATDGSVLWSHNFGSSVSAAWCKVAKLDPDRGGLQLVAWPQVEHGSAFAFDQGVGEGYFMWQTEPPYTDRADAGDIYTPELMVGDMAGIGRNQLVAAQYGAIRAYDGKTGALMEGSNGWNGTAAWISGGVNGRNYGNITLVDFEGDGRLDLLEVCDGVYVHVAAVKSETAGLSLLWDRFIEYESAKPVRTTVNGTGDFNGDGHAEVVLSAFNLDDDGRWHLLVLDAVNGFSAPLLDIPDRYLYGVQDLGGDGRGQIFAGYATTQTPPEVPDTIEVYDFTGTTWERILDLTGQQFLIDPLSPTPETVSPNGRNARREILRGGPVADFFVSGGDTLTGYRYAAGSLTAVWSRTAPGALHRVVETDGAARLIFQLPTGELAAEDADGSSYGSYALGALDSDPIIADIDGQHENSIVVPGFDKVRVLDVKGRRINERWSVSGRGQLVYRGGHQAVTAVDLVGDGAKQIVFVDAAGNNSRMRVLDAQANVVWEHVFPELPAPSFNGPNGIYLWTFGYFTGGPVPDVYVGANIAGYNTEGSRFLRGTDGTLLASQDNGPYYGGQFGPWVGPPAAWDTDEDGIDNLIMLAANIPLDINGTDVAGARLLNPSETLMFYNTPMLIDVDGDGRRELVWGGGFSSSSTWSFENSASGSTLWWRDLAPNLEFGVIPGVIDVNGDGLAEYGVLRTDGVFECSSAVTGEVLWTYDVGSAGTSVATCDIDGDGANEFVFATADGRVIALGMKHGAPRLVWSIDIGYPLGNVVIGDVDHDNKSEILVTAADGYLYLIDQRE